MTNSGIISTDKLVKISFILSFTPWTLFALGYLYALLFVSPDFSSPNAIITPQAFIMVLSMYVGWITTTPVLLLIGITLFKCGRSKRMLIGLALNLLYFLPLGVIYFKDHFRL